MNVELLLEKLCNTQERMTGRQFILDCSTNMFDYIGGILSYMVIAIPIFAGVYDDLDEPALSQGTQRLKCINSHGFWIFIPRLKKANRNLHDNIHFQ